MSQLRTGVLRGGVGFASRALVQLMLFGVTIVATRTLSVADFGIFALATLFLVLVRALFYVGPYEYLLKSADTPDLLRACFVANQVLALCGLALMGAVYLLAPLLFGMAEVGILALLLGPSLLLAAASAWFEAVLLRAGRVRRYYLITLLGDAVGAAAAVVLLLNGYGITALVIQTYVRLTVLMVLYFASSPERLPLTAPFAGVRSVLHWSRERYGAVLLNFSSNYGADLVLGITLSPAATGLYRASNRIVSTFVDLFAQPLQKIAQANISAGFKHRDDVSTSWLMMLSGVGAIAWSGLATLAFMADQLVPILLGDKWAAAVPMIVVFCLVKSTTLLDSVTAPFLVCHDRHRDMLRIQMICAAAAIGLALLASPFGPTTVALAVGCAAAATSLAYGAMVLNQSGAGRSAIANLVGTCGPQLAAVVAMLLLVRILLPDASGLASLAADLAAAAFGFITIGFVNRRRILAAIGSLGHLPLPKAQAR